MSLATGWRFFLIPAALALIAASYWSLFYDRVTQLGEEGLNYEPALRVLRGEFPHVDFILYYSGAFDVYTAGLLRLFGEDILVPRVAVGAVGVLAVLAIYAAGAQIMSRPWAAGAALFFVVWGPAVLYNASAARYADFLNIGSLALLITWHRRSGRPWLVLAGALTGLAFIVRQNSGLYALGAAAACVAAVTPRGEASAGLSFVASRVGRALLWCAFAVAPFVLTWNRLDVGWLLLACFPMAGVAAGALRCLGQETRERTIPASTLLLNLGSLSLGFAAILAAWLLLLASHGGVSRWLLESFPEAISFGNWFYKALPPVSTPGAIVLVTCGVITAAIVTIARAGRFGFWRPLGVAAAASLAGVLLLAAPHFTTKAFTTRAFEGVWELSFRWPPFLAAVGLGLAWLRRSPSGHARTATDGKLDPVFALLPFLAASGLLLYPEADLYYASLMSGPVSLFGLYMLSRASSAIEERLSLSTPGRAANLLLLTAVPAAFAAFGIVIQLNERYDLFASLARGALVPRHDMRLDLARGNVFVAAGEGVPLMQTVGFLREAVPAGEPILVLSTMSILYFLVDRPNPTPFLQYVGMSARITGVSLPSILEAARCRGARYVVVYPYAADLGAESRSLVEAIMTQVATFGPFDIFYGDKAQLTAECQGYVASGRAVGPDRQSNFQGPGGK